MDSSQLEDSPVAGRNHLQDSGPSARRDARSCEAEILREITEQLQRDRDECWQAIEGLASVEPELRLAIIDALSGGSPGQGAQTLLRLLATGRDPATQQAARAALRRGDPQAAGHLALCASPFPWAENKAEPARRRIRPAAADRSALQGLPSDGPESRISGCLVTPVDGLGRGSIVISTTHNSQRRTVAFFCDLQRGVRDVVGDVEPDSGRAGALLDEMDEHWGADGARDIPELAAGLLAGSLMLCGPVVPPEVRDWIDGTLGREFQPIAFPARIPGLDPTVISSAEMPARVHDLLDSCPSWRDTSPLTFELAEEISLREGRRAAGPDPVRDAGLYRFLFEHRIIHRIDLYRRMLLWMAWVWKCSARPELSCSCSRSFPSYRTSSTLCRRIPSPWS